MVLQASTVSLVTPPARLALLAHQQQAARHVLPVDIFTQATVLASPVLLMAMVLPGQTVSIVPPPVVDARELSRLSAPCAGQERTCILEMTPV